MRLSEAPVGDTRDVISHGGQVVAVVVPIEEYRHLRQAMQEQQVNQEFDAARAGYLDPPCSARQSATCRMREAAAVWACRPGELSGRLGDSSPDQAHASSATIRWVSRRSGIPSASSPMNRGCRSRSLWGAGSAVPAGRAVPCLPHDR